MQLLLAGEASSQQYASFAKSFLTDSWFRTIGAPSKLRLGAAFLIGRNHNRQAQHFRTEANLRAPMLMFHADRDGMRRTLLSVRPPSTRT